MKAMHRFATTHPLLFVILATLAWIVTAGLAAFLSALLLDVPVGDRVAQSAGMLTATGFVVFVMWRWGWLRGSGAVGPGDWRLWTITAALTVYIVAIYQLAFFGEIVLDLSEFWRSDVANGILARQAVVGVAEEMMFRGFLLYALVVVWGKTRRGMLAAIAVPALIFGLTHILQTLGGNPLDDTLMTVLNAFVGGLWFGALVILGGSVWPAVLIHAASNAAVQLGALSVSGFDPGAADYAAATFAELPLVIAGLWLLLRGLPRSGTADSPRRSGQAAAVTFET